jgi:phosphoribosylformylglycinamidine synthase
VGRDDAVIARIERDNLVAFRYGHAASPGYPDNPNGSTNDIAGLVDPTRRILGLMPHPERYLHAAQHPGYPAVQQEMADGQRLFENALAAARASAVLHPVA